MVLLKSLCFSRREQSWQGTILFAVCFGFFFFFNGPAPLKPSISELWCCSCDSCLSPCCLSRESEPVSSLPHCASLEWFAVGASAAWRFTCSLFHFYTESSGFFERPFNLIWVPCASNPLCRFRLFFLRRVGSCKTLLQTISQKNPVNFSETVCQLSSINAAFPLCP